MINLKLGKVVVELATEVKKSKKGTEYIQVSLDGAVLGNLFRNEKVTWTLKGVHKRVSFRGDLFLQGTTAGIQKGEVHPETGLIVSEQTSLKNGTVYHILEGTIQGATKVFYKQETGTITISIELPA